MNYWIEESKRLERLRQDVIRTGVPIVTAQQPICEETKTFFFPFTDEEKDFWKSFADES